MGFIIIKFPERRDRKRNVKVREDRGKEAVKKTTSCESRTMLSSMNVDIWMVRSPDKDSVNDGE